MCLKNFYEAIKLISYDLFAEHYYIHIWFYYIKYNRNTIYIYSIAIAIRRQESMRMLNSSFLFNYIRLFFIAIGN